MSSSSAPDHRRRVLIITGDPIGEKLAGPGIRAWNMALELARVAEVTLLTTNTVADREAPFALVRVAAGDARSFAPFHRAADIVVFQGSAMAAFPALRRSRKYLVCDIYVPVHIEHLEFSSEIPNEHAEYEVAHATFLLNEQLARADFILAASERQRLFWSGHLAAIGRINPAVYRDDSSLSRLIDVVPFGLSATPPVHERPALKGVHPAIGEHDKVLLWSGGLYTWFDPFTLIRAVAELSRRHDDVHLFFLGTKHPNPGIQEMPIVTDARRLADELGVLGGAVIFNDSWVDYEDRQNYLLEADLGVSTHPLHFETTLSFRTRILDYLWAGLPMVVTEGDHFGDLVARQGLGTAVPPEDVAALVDALETVLYDEAFHARAAAAVRRVAGSYEWSTVLAPLVRYVEAPYHAADRRPGVSRRFGRPRRMRKIDSARSMLRRGGIAELLHKVRAKATPGHD